MSCALLIDVQLIGHRVMTLPATGVGAVYVCIFHTPSGC